ERTSPRSASHPPSSVAPTSSSFIVNLPLSWIMLDRPSIGTPCRRSITRRLQVLASEAHPLGAGLLFGLMVSLLTFSSAFAQFRESYVPERFVKGTRANLFT